MSGSLSNAVTANGVTNSTIPPEGPKCLTIVLPFPGGPFQFNLLQQIQQAQVSNIQTLFIDNSANSVALLMTVQITGQRLIVPPYSQGTYPIFWPLSSTVTFTGFNGSIANPITMNLLNVPLPYSNYSVLAPQSPASTQLVQDTILESIVSSGYGNVSNYLTGNNGVIYPLLEGTNAYRATISTTTVTTLITGSPSWFATQILIMPSYTATMATAGEVTLTISDGGTGGAGTLVVHRMWIANAAGGNLQFQQLNMSSLNLISKATSGSVLTATLSAALSAGVIDVQVLGGVTSKVAT